MEASVIRTKLAMATLFLMSIFLVFAAQPALAQLKIGYIDSEKVKSVYKDFLDVAKKLQELNQGWEREAKDMQKQIQDLLDQLEAQSLLLSEERKAEKQQEIQALNIKYQQFLNEKWGQQGEALKKEVELMQPVYEKIRKAIQKIGQDLGYHYIFDIVAGNIVYASEDQPDLTDKLLEELNKGIPASTTNAATEGKK
jgi:outer membrane protein